MVIMGGYSPDCPMAIVILLNINNANAIVILRAIYEICDENLTFLIVAHAARIIKAILISSMDKILCQRILYSVTDKPESLSIFE